VSFQRPWRFRRDCPRGCGDEQITGEAKIERGRSVSAVPAPTRFMRSLVGSASAAASGVPSVTDIRR